MYTNNYGMGYGGQAGSGSSGLQMDEAEAVASIQNLSMTELQLILETDGKLDDIVNKLKQVDNITTQREILLASNKSLADYNLSLQPQFEALKRQVATGYEQLNSLKTELAQDIAKLDVHTGQQSMDTLLAVLQTEAAKSEELTEDLASDFCSEKCDVNEFLTQYIKLRSEAHTKRIKAEKMAEIIRNPSSISENNYSSNTPVSNYGRSSFSGGSAPYPVSNSMGMPQPSQPYRRY
ncbi:vacuolar protein sorting-associated protein 37B [Patella vulgata]|uniref:vacuolar protein sorting-associated protein 37B n=1 Tax=Patella vulgata TaxID=6465 RepID=UPI00217F2590|nr:vacuolar protein sorting-associated protein 37B [Patella vulgata]XP_050408161.1 vacuolar protein sorting-associated protein 37B [Patella vulgata]